MADQKVTDLAAATTPLSGSEIIYAVQSGTDVQAQVSQLPISAATQTALDAKQINIQFQDEGSNLGASGTASTVNFTGSGVTASRTSNTITVNVAGGGSSAFNDLTGGTNTTAAMVVGTGASLAASGSGTIVATSATGNAATATTLQTARNINGVSFNGSADITVTAAAGTLTGATLAAGVTASSLTSFGAGIALGTPASGNLANCTFPTLNQNTTGSAATLTTGRTISGTGEATFTTGAFNGSAAVSGSVTLTNSAVIGKVLTGYVSGSGTVAATDTILQAIQKLNGNDGLKANIASPTFTGTVTLPAGQVVNGVTLTTAGSSSNFLNAAGTYTAPTASAAWGGITGTLSSQTDLQTALNNKLDDTQFVGLSKITVGTTAPVAPATNDLWVDTN